MTYLAIDIGGTTIKSGCVTADGTVFDTHECATPRQDRAAFIATLKNLIQPYQATIQGVGLSLPGTIDPTQGLVLACATLPFLENVALETLLHETLSVDLPIVLDNDGNAAALAEKWCGHLQSIQNGAMIVLGTGVGCCLFINDALYYGSHFIGGEASFMVTDLSQKDARAQTAAGLSVVTMVETIADTLHLAGDNLGQQVFQALENQVPEAWQYFRPFTRGVGALIYNLQTALDLQRIVIGGGISVQPLLIQQLQREFETFHQVTNLAQRTIHTPEIMAAHFHNQANLIGAIYPLINNHSK